MSKWQEKTKRPVLPVYMAALVWPIMALLVPIYTLGGLVLTAAVSAGAYFAGTKLCPTRVVRTYVPYATGSEDVDAMLNGIAANLDALHKLNEAIPDPQLSRAMDRMEKAGRSIAAVVEKTPDKARSVDRFARYYLPEVVKLMGTYAALEQNGVRGENAAQIEAELRRESDYLFTLQVRDYLVKKADLKMPAAFLKRWLYTINEGKFSMEEIEKDFDQFLKMFTWNYLQKHFIKTDGISVSKEEALSEAKALAASQFAQYGMPSAPDDMLEGYAEKILADKDQGQKIYEKLYEVKVVEDVKSKVKVTEKAVSADDFAKLAKEL